jgi:hypothetical protein
VDAEKGGITANPAKGPAGTEVTLTVTAKTGFMYETGSLKFKGETTTIPDTGATAFKFTLNKDVTITATFIARPENMFSVAVTQPANGTITAYPIDAEEGDTINLTITPATGYILDTLTYTPEGESAQNITGNTFTMPGKNVTVTGTFKKAANANEFLDAGIRALKEGNYDTAISCFESAYAMEQTPETIVYSSLGKLASIAVDSSVKTFMKDRLGIKNYPGTINSLLSPDWMEVYTDEELVWYIRDGNSRAYWRDEWSVASDNYPDITKVGYYKEEQAKPITMTLGETEMRDGNDLLYYYYDDDLDAEVRWWSDGYNGGVPGYYYYNSTYELISSDKKYDDDDNLIYGYYDEQERYISWYENGPDNSGEAGYYYHSFYTLVSPDPIYFSYYYYDSGRSYEWYESDPKEQDGQENNYTGFTTPGYYWLSYYKYTLVSETPQYTPYPSRFPDLDVPTWYGNTDDYKSTLTHDNLKSSATFNMLLLANLIEKNTNGLNDLLDQLLSSVFGANFEAAYDRMATMNGDAKISADALDAFGVSDIFEGEIYVGKAEMNVLFAAMRIVKASLEWAAAYNWSTDLNFLAKEAFWNDGTLAAPANLPLRNDFLKDRNNGMMAKSKADFIKAIDDSVAAYDSWLANEKLPQGYKDTLSDYKWAKDGFEKFKTAITSGGTFYVKEHDPGTQTYSNTESNSLIGIDLGKFFTPGQLSFDKLIDSEDVAGKGKSPVFYNEDDEKITAKDQITGDYIQFKVKSDNLKEIIVYDGGNIPDHTMVEFQPEMARYIWDWYHN